MFRRQAERQHGGRGLRELRTSLAAADAQRVSALRDEATAFRRELAMRLTTAEQGVAAESAGAVRAAVLAAQELARIHISEPTRPY